MRTGHLANSPEILRTFLHAEALAQPMWEVRHRSVLVPLLAALKAAGVQTVLLRLQTHHDTREEYGPHKTLYSRSKRGSDMGVFARIMMGLAADALDHKRISINSTYLKAHRTASSLRLKKGGVNA